MERVGGFFRVELHGWKEMRGFNGTDEQHVLPDTHTHTHTPDPANCLFVCLFAGAAARHALILCAKSRHADSKGIQCDPGVFGGTSAYRTHSLSLLVSVS
ncbi:hypothetical protein QQF64_019354 [Cirrhinus molitorella]|uniref:Uncharacterized protein n=1 Tax=Cirrhinus molitorella TaxID=172907 RepID=A0ABR3LFD3_9TELE